MGRESRANKSHELKKLNKLSTVRNMTLHVPKHSNDPVDNIFLAMFRGMRPITPEERAEAIAQGIDLRDPDTIAQDRARLKQQALESTKPQKEPEVQLIKLTDGD